MMAPLITQQPPGILFLCVNFNSYKELDAYLHSIDKACLFFAGPVKADVLVADNTSINAQEIDGSPYRSIKVETYPYGQNLGYMGAISKLIEDKGHDHVKTYDYVVVSNVDLILSESFFNDLLACQVDEATGWLAPQIFSLSEKRDRNPKVLHRPTAKRIKMLLLMFKYPVLYRVYTGLVYRFRNKKPSSPSNKQIYAGHGSLMIFTKRFMQHHVAFKYPSFLFGEELFFGELARSSGLKVVYAPEIVVYDIDHASTGKLKRKAYCKMNYESLSKLKPRFE